MPSIPPYSRSEKLEDYAQACQPIKWEEEQIKASDGTCLSVITSDVEVGNRSSQSDAAEDSRLLILYFQGYDLDFPPFNATILMNTEMHRRCLQGHRTWRIL